MYYVKAVRKIKFMSANPTELQKGAGFVLYEHPILGDEAPIFALVGNNLFNTECYDLSDAYFEAMDIVRGEEDDTK